LTIFFNFFLIFLFSCPGTISSTGTREWSTLTIFGKLLTGSLSWPVTERQCFFFFRKKKYDFLGKKQSICDCPCVCMSQRRARRLLDVEDLMHTKETYIRTKETYIHTNATYIYAYIEKRRTYIQTRPIYIHTSKRDLHTYKREGFLGHVLLRFLVISFPLVLLAVCKQHVCLQLRCCSSMRRRTHVIRGGGYFLQLRIVHVI